MSGISATPLLSIVIEDVQWWELAEYQMTQRSDKPGRVTSAQTGLDT